MEERNLVFKLCSLLLEYPQEEWSTKDYRQAVRLITNKQIKNELNAFLDYLDSSPFEDLCENYVKQFDFRTETALYLTYGVFGDNRERGPALVQLKMEFAKAGFFIKEEELPDYLPLILEFASIACEKSTRKIFLIHKQQIEHLKEKLIEENSSYAHLINACLTAFNSLLYITPAEEQNEGNAG